MRIVSLRRADGSPACGVADRAARRGVPSLRALLASGRPGEARDPGEADLPLDGLRFAPVVPDADKIVRIGVNHRNRVEAEA
jgi:hypothetical protein